MVVMLFGGKQDSEPRQPSSRDTPVLSCCCCFFIVVVVLLRCCCERLTVLELFVLLAEVWRGAVSLLFSLSFVLSATLRWKVELQLQVMWRKRE